MKPKYLLIPGRVRSARDGGVHYVGPWALIRLYGVSPRECVIMKPGLGEGLIRLAPRADGDYRLPVSGR